MSSIPEPVSLGGGQDQVNLVERWKAGEIIGDPEIVQLFTERVLKATGDEHVKVIAAFPVNERMREYGPWLASGLFPIACIPCCWLNMICIGPCLCVHKMQIQRVLDNLFYVLTSDGPYVFMRDAPDVGCNCCSSGTDSAKINWAMIMNISINESGRGCGPCTTNASVTLNGGASTQLGPNGRPVPMVGLQGHLYVWHVDHPAEVARLIKAVKQEYYGESAMLAGTVMQQPMAMSALINAQAKAQADHADVRVFVTLGSHPEGPTQIVMVDNTGSDMTAVIKAAAAKLNVPYSTDLSLQLAGVGVVVGSPHEISANDKLVLVGGHTPPGYAEK